MNTLNDQQVSKLASLLRGTDNDCETVIAQQFHCQAPIGIVDTLESHNLFHCTCCELWCNASDMSDFNLICLDCLELE